MNHINQLPLNQPIFQQAQQRGLLNKPTTRQKACPNRQVTQISSHLKANRQLVKPMAKNRFMEKPKNMPHPEHSMTQISAELINLLKPHE